MRILLSTALAAFLASTSALAEYEKAPAPEVSTKDYKAWEAEMTAKFDENWAKMQEAEAAARPDYDKGIELAKAGKKRKAIKALMKARAKLFGHKHARHAQVNRGLSLDIALALANIYEALEDTQRLRMETSFIKYARPWESKEREHGIYMYKAARNLADARNAHRNFSGKKRMKSKERKRIWNIISYLTVADAMDVVVKEGYELDEKWEDWKEEAEKKLAVEAYEDFGEFHGVTAHIDISSQRNYKKGDLLLVINKEVSKVSGSRVTFDFTTSRMMPVNCKSTGELLEISPTGRYIYKQKCQFMGREGGHKLIVKQPKGLRLRKGDLVTMYVRVTKKPNPSKKRKEVYGGVPSVVHSARKDKTQWLLGVKSKKPAYVESEGDYSIKIVDDANAAPKRK